MQLWHQCFNIVNTRRLICSYTSLSLYIQLPNLLAFWISDECTGEALKTEKVYKIKIEFLEYFSK